MPSIINALTASGGGVAITGDATGNLALQTAGNTAVTVTTAQNVGIGTSNPSYPLHVSGSSGDTQIFLTSTATNSSGQFIANGNGAGSYPAYNLYQSGVNYWSVMMRADTNLYFQRQGGSGNTILTDGTFKTPSTISVGNATPSTSGAGITFPATQSASSDVNTLDDYEEGTWTAGWTNVNGNSSIFAQTCTYTKIGRMVCLNFQLQILTGTSTAFGTITNLPFVVSASGPNYITSNGREWYTTGNSTQYILSAGGNTIGLIYYNNSSNVSGSTYYGIGGQITYFV